MSDPVPTRPGAGAGSARRLRRIVVTVLVAWAAVAVVFVVIGALAIRDAQHHLAGARAELGVDNLKETNTPNAQATVHALGRAHTMLGSPVVAPLKLVPVFGRQLRAVDAIAHAGKVVAEVGIDARKRARPIVTTPPKDGPARLRAINTIHDIARDGRTRIERLDFGPSSHLFSSIADTRARFARELNRVGEFLQRADAGTRGLRAFFEGPTHYAVFAANNSEMRAGSGMLLSGGELDVADGQIKLGPVRSFDQLPPAPNNVALEYDFLRLWGPQAPGSDYRFVNMTPRFPTSGALLQRMWKASGATPVDGVLVLDPVAIAELVKVVGSVDVGGQHVTAQNARSLLLHDEYVEFKTDIQRKDFLGEVVQQLFAKLNGTSVDPIALGEAFARAGSGRHLLAWTSDTAQQRGWNALRVDGVLPDQSVLFALANRGGNKLDYFQKITATAKASIGQSGSEIQMDFAITNTTPAGEPSYIAGPVPGTVVQHAGEYAGIAAIDLPANATGVKLTGGDFDLVNGPDGNMQVVSQWVDISPGETVHLRLRFKLPPGSRALSIEPSARVPEISWRAGRESWTDKSAETIAW